MTGFSNFASLITIEAHKKWVEDEQRDSLDKSIDLWVKREEYLPHILLGKDLEDQLQKIGLTKKFNQIFQCLKKLEAFSTIWTEGGFNLNELKKHSLMNISGESECTMKRYSSLRKFHTADGQKVQFELHIKMPDLRIYFLPHERTHKITVGYIGKHLRTCLYD